MSYTGSTFCDFTRIHVCHHCGTFFEYPVSKFLSIQGETEFATMEGLKKLAKNTAENEVRNIPCPKCGQYQNLMMFSSCRKNMEVRIFLVFIFFVFTLFTAANHQNLSVIYLLSLIPVAEIIFQRYKLKKYFSETPPKWKKNVEEKTEFNVSDDTYETYVQTYKWYRSRRTFLFWCLFPAVLPYSGVSVSAFGLIIYYFSVIYAPAYVKNQGFPLYSKNLTFHK